jgi:hypothetical protein
MTRMGMETTAAGVMTGANSFVHYAGMMVI